MKVPDPILNLYRDLRDRRMLSIAIALVVAIIAVPFLMGGGGDESVPPPTSALTQAPFEGSEQLDPVVLAEAAGLRDFRQRLADYRSHNPFRIALTEKERRALKREASGGGNGNGSGSGGSGAGSGTPTDTGTGSTDTGGTLPTGSTGSIGSTDTGSTDTGSTDTGSGDSGSGGGNTGSAGAQLISYRIDVRVGPVGKTKVLEDVRKLEFLPDRRTPLVQFIAADVGGGRVGFIVNPNATAVKGDAECVRSEKDCQYLLMEPKQEMRFLLDDRQYRIQLMSINEHSEPFEPSADSAEDGSDGDGSTGRGLGTMLGG